jgi:hypothetical protein
MDAMLSLGARRERETPLGLRLEVVPADRDAERAMGLAYVSDGASGSTDCIDFSRYHGFPLVGTVVGYCNLRASKDGPYVRDPLAACMQIQWNDQGQAIIKRPPI